MTKTTTSKAARPSTVAAKAGRATAPAQAKATRMDNNGDPEQSHSGLDVQGQFRIGDKISLGVRGGGLVLRQAHSGREVEVSESELQGLLEEEYFVEKK